MNRNYEFDLDLFYQYIKEEFNFGSQAFSIIYDTLYFALNELNLDWEEFKGLINATTNYDLNEEEIKNFVEYYE
jgi:hypothetical protein